MVAVLWAALCSTLPLLALCSGPDNCTFPETSSHNVSPALESLECFNDYQSYIQCKWREDRQDAPLELWNWYSNRLSPCLRYNLSVETNGDRTVKCEYKTGRFAIGITESFFFNTTNLTSCSSTPPKPLKLSQHLRVHPPVNFVYIHEDDLLQWSSPYPTNSSLSIDLIYQLSYRPEGNDTWITNDLTSTQLKLESESLLPGCQYEARVRARGTVGWWSDWSRVETWETKEAPGQVPTLQCVLDGEKEVTCSWKVKRNLAHFITYQLACQHNQTAQFESCCDHPAVSQTETELRYTCNVTVPDPSQFMLKLRPARNIKNFRSIKHIRPIPPANVKVTQQDENWKVEWDNNNRDLIKMSYEIQYWNTLDQNEKQTISRDYQFLNILSENLNSSQKYRVWVRTLVAQGQSHKGIPSEWTEPVEWTSNAASSPSWIMPLYIVTGVIVTILFFTLYHFISNCQRSVIIWVKSVPSPDKSKVISDIMKPTNSCLLQCENTYYICEVQNLEGSSDCPPPLLMLKHTETKTVKHLPSEDGGCFDCDVSSSDNLTLTDNSGLSFSGPYILCPGSQEPSDTSVDLRGEVLDCSNEDYVCLPNQTHSRSTEDLVLHRDDHHGSPDCHDATDCNSPESNVTQLPKELANQLDYVHASSISRADPPADTTCTFTAWPQGGTTQASGYCALPN